MEIALVDGQAQLVAEGLHVLQGVYPGAEDKEHGGGGPSLLEGHFEGDGALLNVLHSELLLNEQPVHMLIIIFVGTASTLIGWTAAFTH